MVERARTETTTRRRNDLAIPGAAKVGALTIAFGLLLDLNEHAFSSMATTGVVSTAAHTAHVVVLVGMVLILVGVVREGVRRSDGSD